MAKFKYVGDPNDDFSGPRTLTVKGHDFRKNVLTEVPDNVAEVLTGHSHFRAEGEDEDTAQQHEQIANLDLDEARAELDKRGVSYPKNAGRAKLADLLLDSGGLPGEGDEE